VTQCDCLDPWDCSHDVSECFRKNSLCGKPSPTLRFIPHRTCLVPLDWEKQPSSSRGKLFIIMLQANMTGLV
jgi:hypothetical protein